VGQAIGKAYIKLMPKRALAPAQTMKVRDWYSMQRWRRRAKHQLRAEPLCCLCKAKGEITPATVADHFPAHGGDYNAFILGPIRSLCAPCHNSINPVIKPRGYSRAIGEDGYPLDPKHPAYRARPTRSDRRPL
jgi:5-methylcytosine-specific restriction protein A